MLQIDFVGLIKLFLNFERASSFEQQNTGLSRLLLSLLLFFLFLHFLSFSFFLSFFLFPFFLRKLGNFTFLRVDLAAFF